MSDHASSEEQGEYQEISRLAVLTCLFGVLSVTVLVHIFFWIVPLFAVLFGYVAWKQTERGSGYVGRGAITVGLVLSVFFCGCTFARHAFRRRAIYRQATEHAKMWLDLVRNDQIYRAHQLIKPPMGRVPPDQLLNDHYENDPGAKMEAEAYFSAEPLKQLREHGSKGSIRLVRNVRQSRKLLEDTVEQLFYLEYKDGDQEVVVPIETVLMRRYDYKEGSCHWEMQAIGVPEESPSR